MRAALPVLVAAATVAGCGAERHGRPRIGVTLPTDSGALTADLRRGMARVADSLQLDVRVVTAGGDRARQAAQVDSLASQRVAAILIDPIDPAALGDAIRRAARARIPVFTMVTATAEADTNDIAAHIGSDDRMAGELAGWYVGQRLNGGGSIAILDQPGLQASRDRVAGIRLALTRVPNVRIVASPAVEPATRATARNRTASLLTADQRVDAFVGTSDELALGALDAVQASPKSGVFIVGFGADPEARAAIARGSPLVAELVPDAVTIGRYALLVAASRLRGNVVMRSVPVRVRLIDRDSLLAP
ncbi:MAG TPA: sugar ABC transporter substrate-binding protein [Gemmatimonadales bacterium]|nr:sugar ABC transporter substrate-binding protein [Gemmatimonadales bacterium]